MDRARRTRTLPIVVAAGLAAINSARSAEQIAILACPVGASPSRLLSLDRAPRHGRVGYTLWIDGIPHEGHWTGSGVDRPRVISTDVDFDGHPDIWVTGDTDAHGRARPSDVWLYDPVKRTYRLDAALSGLLNLEVLPSLSRLESGVTNCGCAGQCFRIEQHGRIDESVRPVSRVAQSCDANGLKAEHWIWNGGAWEQLPAKTAIDGYRTDPGAIDWRNGSGCATLPLRSGRRHH